MNWEAIGAVAEALGAIGVILTLAYLTVQIRQNTSATRSSVRQALSDSNLVLPTSVIENGDFAKIWVKSFNEESLDEDEKLRLQAFIYRDLRHMENAYYQTREGLLADDEWYGIRENLIYLFSLPAYQRYWESEYILFSEPFKKEVAECIASSEKYGKQFSDQYRKGKDGESEAE